MRDRATKQTGEKAIELTEKGETGRIGIAAR
jgi:hypothetical protein